MDCELEIFFRGRQRFVIVRAVVPSRAVHVQHASVLEPFRYVRKSVGAFEQQVLQQMRHSGFAVAFVPRSHQNSHVHGKLWLGLVGEQQQLDTVFVAVFRDTFDFRDELRCLSLSGRGHGVGSYYDGRHDHTHERTVYDVSDF